MILFKLVSAAGLCTVEKQTCQCSLVDRLCNGDTVSALLWHLCTAISCHLFTDTCAAISLSC